MNDTDRFVEDDCDRLRSVHEQNVRAEIELRHAEQMANASWFKRLKIRKQIETELQSRLDDLAPPEASY
ncbi:hypothetical protein OAG71_00475 [bacterium]|nr:hypothetical protein [bacterium]